MADYEVVAEKQAEEFIGHGPAKAAALMASKATVDGEVADSMFSMPDVNVLVVGMCACLLVFVTVISVFLYHREKIRRIVTGENRRVGSVYYVKPGIRPTQPLEI